MSRIQLCAGLFRNGKWFNYAEVEIPKGGILSMLEGPDKTGAFRILNLMRGSVFSFYTESGEQYELQQNDYPDIRVADSWRISRENLRLISGDQYYTFPEFFFCGRCSRPGIERYTQVVESWDKLIEEGVIDDISLTEPKFIYPVDLVDPIEIPTGKTFMGGTYTRVYRTYLTLGDMMKLQKNHHVQSSEANLLYASWDISIVKIEGMPEREFNIFVKRNMEESFSKKYLSTINNSKVMDDADEENAIGLIAKYRKVTCSNCGDEIGGYLDFTNFFSLMLPKRLNQK